jgi:hypothetical protein
MTDLVGINLRGSHFGDNLTGDNNDNVLEGDSGADQLNGGNGVNTASYENAATRVTANLSKAANNTGEALGDKYSSIQNLLVDKCMVRPCVARGFVEMVCGLALMYPASDWSSHAPGPDGYQRACDLVI